MQVVIYKFICQWIGRPGVQKVGGRRERQIDTDNNMKPNMALVLLGTRDGGSISGLQ